MQNSRFAQPYDMKKARPQTGRVEVTSLRGVIYENAARCPVGRRLIKSYYSKFSYFCKKPILSAFVNRAANTHFFVITISVAR